MAYDLLTKKIVPGNCSLGASQEPAMNKPTAALLIAGGVLLVKAALTEIGREIEKDRYQHEFRKGHHPTIETPAVPMHELVGEYDNQE